MPDEEQQQTPKPQPERSEFKGKPVLRIPTVDDPKPDVNWHWMSFGKQKAKAILKYIDEIRKFAEE